MKARISNMILLVVSLAIGLILLESASRWILPISPGARNLSLDGKPLMTISATEHRLRTSYEFRQVSTEFDARARTDSYGNRVTGDTTDGRNPETIFLGDSFTFGHGLQDDQTFAWQYCLAVKKSCANLGRSGTGTLVQTGVLKHYLRSEGWRPREVKLFILAMTSTLMSGNDLLDNYYFVKVGQVKSSASDKQAGEIAARQVRAPSHINTWLVLRKWFLARSNLARIGYLHLAPIVRRNFSPTPSDETLKMALAATGVAFEQLFALAQQYDFKFSIYILHPIQDILRGTDDQTEAALQIISPASKVISTARLFRLDPEQYYFSYDGHLNPEGARRIADFLISND